jgi:hypothetical protein
MAGRPPQAVRRNPEASVLPPETRHAQTDVGRSDKAGRLDNCDIHGGKRTK